MTLLSKAHEFAKVAHDGVYRMGSGEPYVEHVERVAASLAALDFPEHVVAAAYLHDVIEDCPVSAYDLMELFGLEVAALVAEVTNPSEKLADIVKHLAASSYYGASIKLADMLDNSSNMREVAPKFAKKALPKMAAKLAVLGHGHPVLLAQVKKQIEA